MSTNQGAACGQLYVIIFDQLHISSGNEQRARIAAQKFVTTRLRPLTLDSRPAEATAE